MRLAMIIILSAGALGAGISASKAPSPPFEGAWMSCENFRDSYICAYKVLAQRGNRVCGVQSDFATNRFYVQRFVGTARGNVVQVDKICGDPGSETDTYCAGQAPADAAKVGWGSSDTQLSLCKGHLRVGNKGDAPGCTNASAPDGLPKVASLDGQGPEPEDQAWMASCLQEEDR